MGRGRPKGSKNKTTTIPISKPLGRPKKVQSNNEFVPSEQEYSFDLDTIVCISEALWNIRKEVEKIAVAKAGDNKKCIPRKFMVQAFSDLGLAKFVNS